MGSGEFGAGPFTALYSSSVINDGSAHPPRGNAATEATTRRSIFMRVVRMYGIEPGASGECGRGLECGSAIPGRGGRFCFGPLTAGTEQHREDKEDGSSRRVMGHAKQRRDIQPRALCRLPPD